MNWFALLAFSVFGLFHYLGYKFWLLYWVKNTFWLQTFRIALLANYIAVLFYFLARYSIAVPLWLYYLLSLSIGLSFIIFISTLITILFRYLLAIPMQKERRENMKKLAALGGGVFMVSYSGAAIYEGNLRPEIVRLKLDIGLSSLNDSKPPLKAVQLSDLHIGGLIGESYIRILIQEVNSLNPDIIFLTGDITDAPITQIQHNIALLKELKATFGCYYILGNHEFFHGVEDAILAIKECGIQPLINDSIVIDNRLNVAGISDYMGFRMGKFEPNIEKTFEKCNPNLPTILLAHQPKLAKEIIDSQNTPLPISLILSGHTHGGQIFPFSFFVILQQGFLKGLYQLNEHTKLYISKGTGFWGPPMRLGTRSEITFFEFV